MNFDTKTVALIMMGIFAIFGWNYLLIQRDNKLFDGLKQRNEQVCQQLKDISPDCR